MRFVLSALLLLSGPALAQAPVLPGATAQAPKLEIRFVTESTDTQRFFDRAEPKGVPLVSGDAVQVVAEHAGLVRVFVKGGFGWVAPANLSTEPPALPEPAPGELPPLLPPG
jgi:hypothetical protein